MSIIFGDFRQFSATSVNFRRLPSIFGDFRQFSATFVNEHYFRRLLSIFGEKMASIFGDFHQFSAKKWRFS
jgi:hypothetical protein